MAVYLVAALQLLAYLGAVPVCVAFRLTGRGALRLGVGVGAFRRGGAMKRARRAAKAVKPRPGGGGGRLARGALMKLRVEAVSLRGSLGLGDAALTALACALLTALAAALGARAGRVEAGVSPRFDAEGPEIDLKGMIRARAGQIMLATARSGAEIIVGRIAQWIDRLRA